MSFDRFLSDLMTRDWNSGWGQQTGWQEPQWDDKDGGENGEWKGDESGENIQSKESNQEVSGEVEERYSWKNATDGQTYWDQTEWSTYKKQFAIDWNELRKTLPEFDKDFYIPHPNVENRSDSEVAEILSLNKIQIIPSDNVEGKKWDDSKWESSPARPIPKPVTNLIEASFPEYITEKLCQELGGPLVEPTAVQKLLWPVALSGRDCVAIAPTGTGKTLGYLLPAIVHITAQEPVKPTDLSPIGLVILPSRELAQQVMEQAVLYGSSITDLGFEALRPVCVYGGVKKSIQQDELASKVPDLIVATPGRLMDFLGDGTINLSRVTYLVIDEVDRLISMDGKLGLHENGFVEDMLYISSLVRPERQCIMCSATGQRDVMHLARDLCGNEPVFFQIAEAEKTDHLIVNPNIEQHFTSAGDSLHDRLGFLIDHVLPSTFTEELGRIEQKMMIFANSKTRVDKITEVLRAAGWPAVGFHSDKSQAEREWIFENFKTGVCNILVSTDVMGRGMDFEDVRAVVNFDLPDSIEAYVHRVGRTGRIGKKVKKGYALSFLSKRDWLILPGLEKLLTDSGLEVPENLQKRIEEFHSYQHKSR